MQKAESFDWVDEQNHVIGQTTKEEAHHRGYPHRIVAIFVFNEAGELLVNEREDNGLWDHSVGGHLRASEPPEQGVNREGMEEVGLPEENMKEFIGTCFVDESLRGKPIKHWFSLFRAQTDGFTPAIDTREVRSVRWIPLVKLTEDMRLHPERFSAGFLGTMNCYLKATESSASPIPIR